MRLPPSIDPKIYTLSAIIVGYLLIDDLTAIEQISVGRWFILVGQVLGTNGSQKLVLKERENGDPFNMRSSNTGNNNSTASELELLKRTLAKIQRQIEILMKEKNI